MSRPNVKICSVTATTAGDSATTAKNYHHGDLPTALRAATAELITEKGATGFSLREVARRAGVSHSAPAHHFGDSQGLLTSVAAEGFHTLVASFEELQPIEDPLDRLNKMGKAYIRTALENPGHFGVMCASELINEDDDEFCTVSGRAFEILVETVSEIAAAHNPSLNIEAAATWIWSSVHGLAVLLPGFTKLDEKAGTDDVDLLLDQFSDLMSNGLFKATAAYPE